MSTKRLLALLVALLSVAMVTPSASAAPEGPYRGKASSLALALDLLAANPSNPPGLTAGLSFSEVDNARSRGRGAGSCEAIAPSEDPSTVPCTSANVVAAESTGALVDPARRCDQSLPAPIGQVVVLQEACGDARASGADASASATGEVARVELKLNLTPIAAGAESAKDQVVTAVDTIADPLPDTVERALIEALNGNDRMLAVAAGHAASDVSTVGDRVVARADASGASLGILGVPFCSGDPVVCTTDPDPISEGLIIVQVVESSAEASWDGRLANAAGRSDSSLVKVLLRDINRPAERAYLTVAELGVGQGVTVLQNTALETTVSVNTTDVSSRNTDGSGSAVATASGVEVHALKGIGAAPATAANGGVRLRLASVRAEVEGTAPRRSLAATGFSPVGPGIAIVLLALLLAASMKRRSVTKPS